MDNVICVDRVAFSIGSFDIYWYGVIMCLAIVSAVVLSMIFCKIRKIPVDTVLNIALIIIPAGILGARLFAVLFDSELSITDYFNFRTGGMSIMGSIVFGAIAMIVYTIIKKEKNFFVYFDIICSVLLLSQAIGRWGNYFNSEVYGQEITSSSIFSKFPFAVTVSGKTYQALFFYESVIDFIGFIFSAQIFLYVKKDGYTLGFYLMYYGLARTILEHFRQGQYILRLFGLPISLICSIIMFIAGVVITVFSIIKYKKSKELKL